MKGNTHSHNLNTSLQLPHKSITWLKAFIIFNTSVILQLVQIKEIRITLIMLVPCYFGAWTLESTLEHSFWVKYCNLKIMFEKGKIRMP